MRVGSSFAGTGIMLADSQKGREKRLTSTDNGTIVPWEARVWWIGGRGAPEMIGRVGEEVGPRFMEEGRFSAISLRKNDFVEQPYCWIVRALGFPFVNELIESYSIVSKP